MFSLIDVFSNNMLDLEGKKYCLLEVVGKGGSSIVYKAREEGSAKDYVVIKEFYPHDLNVCRLTNGSIKVPENKKGEYERRMTRAKVEASIVDKLRRDDEIKNNNPWFLSYDKPIEANNTLYTVIATEAGDMLSSLINPERGYFQGKDFVYICDCILKILEALKPIHKQNYLHLDISPDNIHLSHVNVARLIDYNSAFHIGGDTHRRKPNKRKCGARRQFSCVCVKTDRNIVQVGQQM